MNYATILPLVLYAFANYTSGHPIDRTIIRLTKHAQAVRLMMAHMGQGERAVAPPRPDEIEEK